MGNCHVQTCIFGLDVRIVGSRGSCRNPDLKISHWTNHYPVTDFDGSYLNEKFTSEDLILLKKRCKLAVDVFVYKVKKYIGSYYFILGKVDAIILNVVITKITTTTCCSLLTNNESAPPMAKIKIERA